MDGTGKRRCRDIPAGERCTGDYLDLDHSGRRVYRNQPTSCRASPANRPSCCIHSGYGAFSSGIARAVASAGRFKHRRCAPYADGDAVVLLFNVIAGAAAIPQDLLYTTDLLRLSSVDRWRTLILPALFPYIITGAITASGGAWNASIVAEYVEFGGQTHATTGVGALIAQATGTGDYALLLAATLALVITVIFINRSFWRRLYRLAEERYRME
jgi:hypothetical protein